MLTTKGHKGTGLGLAIVQKITEQHGGQLLLDDAEVTAERVSGARVTLSLPRSMMTTDTGCGGRQQSDPRSRMRFQNEPRRDFEEQINGC